MKTVDDYVNNYKNQIEKSMLPFDERIINNEFFHSELLIGMGIDMRLKELKRLFPNISNESMKKDILKITNLIFDDKDR